PSTEPLSLSLHDALPIYLLQRHPAGETCFCKLDITAERVIDTRGASYFVCRRPDGIDLAVKNELLDFFLDLIVQLVTVVPEKFDAVVLLSSVRSGNDGP